MDKTGWMLTASTASVRRDDDSLAAATAFAFATSTSDLILLSSCLICWSSLRRRSLAVRSFSYS